MKILHSLIMFIFIMPCGYAQRLTINDTTYRNWTTVNEGTLSNNGLYSFYRIKNQPIGSSTVVLMSNDNKWEKHFGSFNNLAFTADSKYLLAMHNDSLIKINLDYKAVEKISNCTNYQLYKNTVIYQTKDFIVHIENLATNNIFTYSGVNEVILNSNGGALVLKSKGEQDTTELLRWLDLNTGKIKTIYRGRNSLGHIFDKSGHSMVFLAMHDNQKSIWYFNVQENDARAIVNDKSSGIITDHQIDTKDTWLFSKDGKYLFFTQSPDHPEKDIKTNEPAIWTYKDPFLLSRYKNPEYGLSNLKEGQNLSVVDIEKRQIRQLLHGNEKVKKISFDIKRNDVLIVESSFGIIDDLPWNISSRITYSLCFVKTGELIPIINNSTVFIDCMELSPDGKFLVYYDKLANNYISYNVETKISENISKNISSGLKRYNMLVRDADNSGLVGIGGWIEDTHKLIIQGTYDLWEIDLDGKFSPINLTTKQGINHEIIYSPATWHDDKTIPRHDPLLIIGIENKTKLTSLYYADLDAKNIKSIYSTDYFIAKPYEIGPEIQKSKNANIYLLQLQKVSKSPNYFITSDFKNVIPITENYPEKKYTWITSELANYKDYYGNYCEGILYKPEDFDPKKKYPVIFYYYLDQSNYAFKYIDPSPVYDGVNVPLIVSNGYILFKPNIYQRLGKPGESALESVLAAANYLSKFEWIDSLKMGICGHSFGGVETNYIVTHSNRFAAAFSAAGVSNWVELYNDLWKENGANKQGYMILGPGIMGEGLEDIPDEYNKNSPILYTKNITTPLLLLHNDGDVAVPVDHSIQMFVQLRKLQKPVWLVQYKGENHAIRNSKNQIDFQSKLKGFFDFYLKQKPQPKWMMSSMMPN
jgi:dienelactone hydrolase